MRQGIREFLLVISVVFGGLALSSNRVAADDGQPAPPPEQAAPEQAATEAEAPPGAEAPDTAAPGEAEAAVPASQDEPATDEPATDEPATDEPATDEPAKDEPAAHEPEPGAAEKHGTPGEDHKEHGEEHGEEHDDHGDHAGHDPHDLTHVNATEAIADPSEVRSDLALWTLVVFLCLLALLAKFAWGPIMEGLERRENAIAAAIEEAEQAAAKGAEQLKLYEAKLAAAADETREILAQARRDAEATGDRIVREAQESAARERDKAIADISAAKNVALQEITERSVDLAVAMAGRMIQRQLTADDRAGLIREALDQLPNQN